MVKERIAEDRVLEGWNRCADGSDSFLVSQRFELTISGNHGLRCYAFSVSYERARE